MWEEPFSLLDIQGETCTVLLPPPARPYKFYSTFIKIFLSVTIPTVIATGHERRETTQFLSQICTSAIALNTPLIIPNSTAMTTGATGPIPKTVSFWIRMVFKSPHDIKYATSRKKEIDRLMERILFSSTTYSDASGHRGFGFRRLDHMTHEGTLDAYETSHLAFKYLMRTIVY